ncbi:aspartic peptidase domain-containing protein [Copromyces sp. CBS 386.78]|nr:aspartic peptidase domain-containing protein [Copromyces sp. CBS 386.78]
MLVLFKLFILSVLLSLVVAAPLTKRSFKIERVRNPNYKGRNGPRELLKAYRKYRMPVPQPLLDAMNNQTNGTLPIITTTTTQTDTTQKCSTPNTPQPGASGSSGTEAAGEVGVVTATPEQDDVEYLAPVKIGGQTINLDFDSGSSDLWVFNTQLSPQITRGHQVYNPAASKTFKLLQGQTFSISYGDGSAASGNVGTDVVEIGGVAVQNQAVELATKVSQTFIQDTQNNGLLGLAFSKLNTVQPQQQKTFFDNVLPSLAEPVFTADLRHNAVGAYEFGRIDNSKFTGALAWIPVNTAMGFWQFTTSAFSVGNSQAQRVAPAQAIADTGTTLMLVSQAVANAYYSQVQGARNDPNAGGVTFPCNTNLPDLFVDVGGRYMARIKGDDIRFAQIDATTCFGGVQPTTSGLEIWGDIFFKSQFVVFNGGNNSLGMAQHV